MSQFSVKQHEKLLRLLIETAAKTKKETFYVPLKQVAGIYDFMNLLWDEEEMEFVLEDIFMDLTEAELSGHSVNEKGEKVSHVLEGCGILKSDYRGDGRNLFFTVVPELKDIGKFSLTMFSEEEEEEE